MARWLCVVTAAVALVVLFSGSGLAQDQPPGCDQAATPQKVDAQVVSIDQGQGKLTVRDENGTIHEFQASRETLQELTVGDRIEATLRTAAKC